MESSIGDLPQGGVLAAIPKTSGVVACPLDSAALAGRGLVIMRHALRCRGLGWRREATSVGVSIKWGKASRLLTGDDVIEHSCLGQGR